jgi:predicted acylesterase/phospholipase RssA
MKGGITSGIVYPPAILELATAYRFRSIGGTSAGAIAAAAAAAAEVGRESGGFEKLEELRAWVRTDHHLLGLFQPSREARPLFETLLLTSGEKRDKPAGAEGRAADVWYALPLKIRQALRFQQGLLLHDRAAIAAGAVVGTTLAYGAARTVGGTLAGGRLILPAWLGGLVGGVAHLAWIMAGQDADTFFGLCPGLRAAPDRPEALTEWLSASINDLAGPQLGGQPLTFGHLRRKTAANGVDASITLKMVTTNLSQGEPYVFPRETETFLAFKRAEMERLFPPDVVGYMVDRGCDKRLPEGYYRLSTGDDLPVIVATRMSLSFPLLLGAVPLYTLAEPASIAYRRAATRGRCHVFDEKDLQPNWFSDGGLCSNFPIHFFDAWLPERPTFGINLTSLPDRGPDRGTRRTILTSVCDPEEVTSREVAQPCRPTDRVCLPQANAPQRAEWKPIRGTIGFAKAIVDTMQNCRDRTQARLPSYRERVVQVRFDNEREGGMHLAMDRRTIEGIEQMGTEAGRKLLPGGEFNFDHHLWVRLQVLMAQLETQLRQVDAVLGSGAVDRVLEEQTRGGFPYCRGPAWSVRAKDCLAQLQNFITELRAWTEKAGDARSAYPAGGATYFGIESRAEPIPELRVTTKG